MFGSTLAKAFNAQDCECPLEGSQGNDLPTAYDIREVFFVEAPWTKTTLGLFFGEVIRISLSVLDTKACARRLNRHAPCVLSDPPPFVISGSDISRLFGHRQSPRRSLIATPVTSKSWRTAGLSVGVLGHP